DFQKSWSVRRFFWNIIPELMKSFLNCGLLIMEESSLTIPSLNNRAGFQIPFWVRMEIDISRPTKELFGDQRSDIERRIRKNKLSYEVTKDPQQFEDFYHRIFIPYVKMRYTDTVGFTSYEEFLASVPVSEILL